VQAIGDAPRFWGDPFFACGTAYVSWSNSVDVGASSVPPSGVASYRLYKNGALVQSFPSPTLGAIVPGLTAGASVLFEVSAVDVAGNESPRRGTNFTLTDCVTPPGSTNFHLPTFDVSCDQVTFHYGSADVMRDDHIGYDGLQSVGASGPIYRDGVFIGLFDNWPNDRAVVPGHAYTYSIDLYGQRRTIGQITIPACNDATLRLAPQLDDLSAEHSWAWQRPLPLGSGFVVFAVKALASGDLKLMASTVSVDGTVVPYEAWAIPNNNVSMEDVIATPTGYIFGARDLSTSPSSVILVKFDKVFRFQGLQRFSADNVKRVSLAGKDGTYGVLSDINNPHQTTTFRNVYEDGTFGPAVSFLGNELHHNVNFRMAWDGARFGVVYENDGYELALTGSASDPEVYVATMSATGTVLTNNKLSDALEIRMIFRTNATLTARPGGGFYVVWVSSTTLWPISTVANYSKDLLGAIIGADGNRIGSNVHLTNDGEIGVEQTPVLTTMGSNVFMSYRVDSVDSKDGLCDGSLFGVVRSMELSSTLSIVATRPEAGPDAGFGCYFFMEPVSIAMNGSTSLTTYPTDDQFPTSLSVGRLLSW
jgi:hypothetical protein